MLSDVTYGRDSLKKNVQNMLIDICTKFHASFTIWSIFLSTSSLIVQLHIKTVTHRL